MRKQKTETMKTKRKKSLIEALVFGILCLFLFGSPMKADVGSFDEMNSTQYKKDYSRIYLEILRKKYETIYNDENKSLEELTTNRSK